MHWKSLHRCHWFPPKEGIKERVSEGISGKYSSFGLLPERSSGGQHAPAVMQHGIHVLKRATHGALPEQRPHQPAMPSEERDRLTTMCCHSPNAAPSGAGHDEARSATNHALTLFYSL